MRILSAPAAAALSSPAPSLVLLLEMGYTPPIYAASSAVDVEWDGRVYIGAGRLGSVDAVRDTTGEITNLKFTLSGVPSSAIAQALGESARNKVCTLRLAIIDEALQAVTAAPVVFSGVLDQTVVAENDETATIAVTVIHMGALMARRKTLLYTDADQKRLNPGDTSLRFVVSQSQKKDVWPASTWKP